MPGKDSQLDKKDWLSKLLIDKLREYGALLCTVNTDSRNGGLWDTQKNHRFASF